MTGDSTARPYDLAVRKQGDLSQMVILNNLWIGLGRLVCMVHNIFGKFGKETHGWTHREHLGCTLGGDCTEIVTEG